MVTNQYTTILTHSIFLFNKSHIQKLMLLFVQNHNIKPLIFAFWLAWFLFLYFIFALCIYLTDFVVSFLMSSIFLCVNNPTSSVNYSRFAPKKHFVLLFSLISLSLYYCLFLVYLCENNPQEKMPVCECFAFLTYFLLLSLYISNLFYCLIFFYM